MQNLPHFFHESNSLKYISNNPRDKKILTGYLEGCLWDLQIVGNVIKQSATRASNGRGIELIESRTKERRMER